MQFPKPERRGQKPPKPIRRGRAPARFRRRNQRGLLRKLAEDVMSLYIRHRDGWTCWRCGSRDWNSMQAAHLMGKGSYPATKFAEWNVRCLCSACHSYFTWRPIEWRRFLVEKLGETEVEKMEHLALARSGPHDYSLYALYYANLLRSRDDLWKIGERFDALVAQGRELGVSL